ncbi:MAG: NAD(P)/FAD-dependent oxidoreductase [Pseudomonadota bacterium]
MSQPASSAATAASPSAAPKPRIVVVGGGAGGLELVAALGRRLGRKSKADIMLVDRNSSHIWKPLLHEVATGALDSSLDEVGYREHAHRFGYRYLFGEMSGLDREAKEVIVAPTIDEDGEEIMAEQRIRYDYLVMAVGSVSNDFGTKGVAEHCIFLDRRQQAERFRQKLLNLCVAASLKTQANPAEKPTVDVAIVGGGATGVELSAELRHATDELRYYGLDNFDQSQLRTVLLEAGPRILPALPERISNAAHEELENIGVKVLCNARVIEVTREGMKLADDGPFIEGDLKVWAAGVKAPEFLKDLGGLETTRGNLLVVEPTLRTTRDPAIFAIGDCAACPMPDDPERYVPPRAQAAHQMAECLVKNLLREFEGKPLKPYKYTDFGALVNLSRFSTVGSLMGNLIGGSMKVEGRIARIMYISLYRMHLSAVHGWFRAAVMTVVGHIARVVRPRVKLH